MNISLNKNRLSSITVYGAVGPGIKKPIFMDALATNIEETKKFIIMLRKSLKNVYRREKPVLVMDQHPSHRSRKTMEIIEPYFKVLL